MKKFSTDFITTVNDSIEKSKDKSLNEPNLFFIGFGNPNSNIIIFGKEHTYPENSIDLKYENINNSKEWKEHIEENFIQERNLDKIKKIPSELKDYNNAFIPYITKKPEGHTWSKYQKLINKITENENSFGGEFLFDCFITEINVNPSKISEIKIYENKERLEFFQNNFFQNFKVKILACGKYLSDKQISQYFNIDINTKEVISDKPKLNVFKDKNQIIVNTRQLSMNVSNDYIQRISTQIKLWISNQPT